MQIQIYGFDWNVYTKRVMPAFYRWLVEREPESVGQLYELTRYAQEETFLPATMQTLLTWTQACTRVAQLSQGKHAVHEYQILCDAEKFTLQSDRYIHRHPPQLYHNIRALRIVWSAIIEEYCQTFVFPPTDETQRKAENIILASKYEYRPQRGEIVSLLRAAGLEGLADEIGVKKIAISTNNKSEIDSEEGTHESSATKAHHRRATQGFSIGDRIEVLRIRDWLGTYSIHALTLFELLAHHRRSMPFGYNEEAPYERYAGYLTPEEACQLAYHTRHITISDQAEHAHDSQHERKQRLPAMTDAGQPHNANALLKVIRMASQYGLGLICSR